MPGFTLLRELELYEQAGIPRADVLYIATLGAATVAGKAKELGSIEPGKLADLIVTDGDPLEITTRVEQVWSAGRPVSMETRQTGLFQKYDARPRGAQARQR